jgi:hypothetical protein
MSAVQPPPLPAAPCPICGCDVQAAEAFCPGCGADLHIAAVQGARRGGSRPWALIAALVLLATAVAGLRARFLATGPGPDPVTTLRWMALGDGQRRPTLATLSRAYETARAVARYCLDQGAPTSLAAVDWGTIESYDNADYRGFVSLVLWAADHSAIRGRLASLLTVDGTDGWGRPWHATLLPWPASIAPSGLYPDVIVSGPPPPSGRVLLHLTLVSAGSDGTFGDADDITFEAVFPAAMAIRLNDPAAQRARDAEIERGRVWVRWRGTTADLVDARLLAEFYLTSAHRE